jgi:hypothetical protein
MELDTLFSHVRPGHCAGILKAQGTEIVGQIGPSRHHYAGHEVSGVLDLLRR